MAVNRGNYVPVPESGAIPIPGDKLGVMVGELIHLGWSVIGRVWRIVSVDGDWLNLETPKTKKPMRTHAGFAYYTRGNQPDETGMNGPERRQSYQAHRAAKTKHYEDMALYGRSRRKLKLAKKGAADDQHGGAAIPDAGEGGSVGKSPS